MSLKTHSTILASILLCLIFSSCNNDERQIRKIAKGYIDATGNYKIEEAYQYATKSTRETTLPYISNVIMPIVDSNYLKANVPATSSIDSVIIVDDTAWVLYTKTTPLGATTNQLCLFKEEGRWLVDVPLAIPETFTITPNGITTDTASHALTEMQKFSKAE